MKFFTKPVSQHSVISFWIALAIVGLVFGIGISFIQKQIKGQGAGTPVDEPVEDDEVVENTTSDASGRTMTVYQSNR